MSRIPPRNVPKPPPIPCAPSTSSSFVTLLMSDDSKPEPESEHSTDENADDSDWVVPSLHAGQIVIFTLDFILLLFCFWPFLNEELEFGAKMWIFIANIFTMSVVFFISRALAAAMQVLIVLYQDRK